MPSGRLGLGGGAVKLDNLKFLFFLKKDRLSGNLFSNPQFTYT
jgi:hypothetical protein